VQQNKTARTEIETASLLFTVFGRQSMNSSPLCALLVALLMTTRLGALTLVPPFNPLNPDGTVNEWTKNLTTVYLAMALSPKESQKITFIPDSQEGFVVKYVLKRTQKGWYWKFMTSEGKVHEFTFMFTDDRLMNVNAPEGADEFIVSTYFESVSNRKDPSTIATTQKKWGTNITLSQGKSFMDIRQFPATGIHNGRIQWE
jgi:hypothetical protein